MQAVNIENKIAKTAFDPDDAELDRLFLDLYVPLKRYAFTLLPNAATAEEMVQQVFFKILERPEPILIHSSVKAYFYRAVHNECLNHIKHQQVRKKFEIHSNQAMKTQNDHPTNPVQLKELEQQIQDAINELPEQCRTIFQLSRFENLKYSEIAGQLGLSVKTVETQMSRALKKLRLRLADYLPLLIWLLIQLIIPRI